MTAQVARDALERNRVYCDFKEAEAQLAQAKRDLSCGFINEHEYLLISDVCNKTIKAYRLR